MTRNPFAEELELAKLRASQRKVAKEEALQRQNSALGHVETSSGVLQGVLQLTAQMVKHLLR